MKRIIAISLTMLLILGTVILPVAAEEEVSYPDFQFAAALGFMNSEEIYPDEAITRAQLAHVYHNIVFYGNGAEGDIVHNAQDSTIPFTDVKDEDKDAVKLVNDMGIMTGYSGGEFRPDDPVTFHQLVKTMVVFLGYDAPAKELGGWTVGYLTMANRLGILPGGNISGEAVATCGAVGQMLKLATGADVMLTTNGVAKVLTGVNYLKHWCKISMTRGKVTGNYLTNTATDEDSGYFGIYLDDTYMAVAASAAGVQDKLGYTIAVYYKEVNGTKTIVCYEEEQNNNVLEIDADEILSANTSQITYSKNGGESEQAARMTKNAVMIYNGSYLASYTDADMNPFSAGVMDGMVRLIDNDANGAYDMIVVEAYTICVVSSVSNGKIYNEYNRTDVIDISDYQERNINIINILGEPVVPEDIKAGQVLNVCRDKDGNIKSIMASKDTMAGILESYRSNGSTITHITVNGTEVEVLPRAMTVNGGKALTPGMNVTLYFSRRGKVAYIDGLSTQADGWQTGLIIDMASQGTFTEVVQSKVFTSDSKVVTIYFPEKLEINGNSVTCTEQELLNQFGRGSDNRVDRQAFMYKTNEAGDTFTAIRIAAKSDKSLENFVGFDGFYQFPEGPGTDGAYTFQKAYRTFNDKIALDSSALIFAIPSEAERHEYDEYMISTIPVEEGSESMDAKIYGSKKESMVAEIVVTGTDKAGGSFNLSYQPFFVVSDAYKTKNEDGEKIVKVEGEYIQRTTYRSGSFEVPEDVLVAGLGAIPDKGDIIRVPDFYNNDNAIKDDRNNVFLQIFDADKAKFVGGTSNNPYTDAKNSNMQYIHAKVMDKQGNVVKIRPYGSNQDYVYLLTASYFKMIEVKTSDTGKVVSVKSSTPNCVVAENDCPGEGSDIVMYKRTVGIGIVVYN